MYDFLLPDIGEGLHEAEIVRWFVQTGQSVKANELLVEVQTDKAVVEITSPVQGVIVKLGGEEGAMITVGSLLCQFEERQDAALVVSQEISSSAKGRVKAAPSVRKAARHAGVNIEEINGTGPNGRVLRTDIERYVQQKANTPVVEKVEVAKQSASIQEPKVLPIRGVRKTIFDNMEKATSKAVLCTGMDKINVTKLVEFKKACSELPEMKGIRLTYLPFILKAVANALEKYDQFNAYVDEEQKALVIHPHIHLGVAVATEDGLLVPVLRDVHQKSIVQIAKELDHLLDKIATKTIAPHELKGSTFTISSTGKGGGTFATPITNYPEVAILGVHKIAKEPVVVEDDIQIGYTMTLSCTFDHRVIDGEPAGRFMHEVASYLQNPIRFIL